MVVLNQTKEYAMDFLERQLERREEAGDAAAAGDARSLDALLAAVRAESFGLEQRVAALLDTEGALDIARQRVRELKFLQKFAADIDAMLAQMDD